jgi:hypothetical protein
LYQRDNKGREVRHTTRVAAVAAVAIIGVASQAGAVQPKSITVKAAGKQYLELVTSADTALATFLNQAGQWTSTTTNAQAVANAAPAVAAMETFQRALTVDRWPGDAKRDVKHLVTATGGVKGDLNGLATVNLANESDWAATFTRDASKVSTDIRAVGQDLRLPQRSYQSYIP